MKKLKRVTPYIVLFVCLLPVILPLYSNSLLGSADNLAHLFRVVNLDYALKQGYLWPRWAALEGHGFGAPIFAINYVLPYYIVVGLWYLTDSLLHASQIYMMLVLFLSACSMYILARKFFGIVASVSSAVAYAYFPYHLMTMYLYGGYGEALAFVLSPLVLVFLYTLLHKHSLPYFLATSFSLGLLILSHNLSALMTVILMITFVPVLWRHDKHKVRLLLLSVGAIFTSALISAWFWIPALVEQRYTKLGILFEKESALRGYFFQLIAPVIENSWKLLRFEPPGYYSYAIGIPSLIVFSLGILFVILKRSHIFKKTSSLSSFSIRFGLYGIFWGILSFVLTRSISAPLWSILPSQLNFISYPYRFFFITTFAVSIITGFVIDIIGKYVPKKPAFIATLLITGLFIWQGLMYSKPAIDSFSFEESYFQSAQTVRYAPNTYKNMGYIEFIPKTADSTFVNSLDDFPTPKSKVEILSGQAIANLVMNKAQDVYVDINASTPSILQVNTLYFPGWIAIINNKRVIPAIDTVGRMLFNLPIGQYQMHISFRNTPIRSIAASISIISIFCLILYGLRKLLSLIMTRK